MSYFRPTLGPVLVLLLLNLALLSYLVSFSLKAQFSYCLKLVWHRPNIAHCCILQPNRTETEMYSLEDTQDKHQRTFRGHSGNDFRIKINSIIKAPKGTSSNNN